MPETTHHPALPTVYRRVADVDGPRRHMRSAVPHTRHCTLVDRAFLSSQSVEQFAANNQICYVATTACVTPPGTEDVAFPVELPLTSMSLG